MVNWLIEAPLRGIWADSFFVQRLGPSEFHLTSTMGT